MRTDRDSPLPSGWRRVQLRHLVKIRNGADPKAVEELDGDYPVYGSGGEYKRANDFLYDGTSLLFGRKGTIDRPLLVHGKFWTVDTMFYTEIGPLVDERFLYYASLTIPFKAFSTSTALPSITQSQLGSQRIPLPPLAVQRAIADYLDRETAQIDTLIEEQQRLTALAKERRVAVAESVLEASVGGPQRLRWSIAEVDERAGEVAPALPLLSVSISWGVRRREEVSHDLPRAEDLSSYKLCRAGDIVLNRMRAFQGALGVAPEAGVVSPDYAVLRCDDSVEPEWLGSVMRTKAFVAEMAKRIRGIGSESLGSARTPRINISDLREIGLTIPTRQDQRGHLDDIGRAVSSIDQLLLSAQAFIALARERRAALITAAVTGQIDVGVAA